MDNKIVQEIITEYIGDYIVTTTKQENRIVSVRIVSVTKTSCATYIDFDILIPNYKLKGFLNIIEGIKKENG